MKKMRFLVPVDFSSSAKNASSYAAGLAKATDSRLILIHVISPFVDENTYLTTDIDTIMAEAEKQLGKYMESITNEYKIQVNGFVVRGETTEEIMKAAEIEKAEFVVMGTHEVNPLMKFLFGSTTADVIEKSTVSVVAIPENISFAVPTNIVYASDYENSDIEALKELAKIAEFFGSEINVVHITNKHDEPGTELSIIEYFSDLVNKHISYPRIVCRVFKHENKSRGIEIFAKTAGANLIAMSTRRHGLLGKLLNTSLTKEFVYNSSIPIIAFHQHEMELSN